MEQARDSLPQRMRNDLERSKTMALEICNCIGKANLFEGEKSGPFANVAANFRVAVAYDVLCYTVATQEQKDFIRDHCMDEIILRLMQQCREMVKEFADDYTKQIDAAKSN